MARRDELMIRLPEPRHNSGIEPSPLHPALHNNGHHVDVAKVEQSTLLHEVAMKGQHEKAELYIKLNSDVATKSAETFGNYVRGSAARVESMSGNKFEKDVQLAEYHNRQQIFDALDLITRQVARQTAEIASLSVLPKPEPKKEEPKGFFSWLRGR